MVDEVLTEVRGRVLVITLNRPETRNAINTDMAQGLLRAVEQLDTDPTLSVGVLTGAGGAFSSGMDLKAFAVSGTPKGLDDFTQNGSAKPMIAAIESFALAGGLELALTCDLVVAASNARFGIPEVRRGLFAGAGGLLRLPRLLPYSAAMEMALTGEPISAETALQHGLLARMSDPGCALDVAIELAERIAQNAPLALRATKQLIRSSKGRTEEEFWDLQKPFMAQVFRSDDAREGARAFAAKRPAEWTGQ